MRSRVSVYYRFFRREMDDLFRIILKVMSNGCWVKLLRFEIYFKFFSLVFFMPLFNLMLNIFYEMTGDVLINADVFKSVLTNPIGLIWLLIIQLVAFFALFIEIGGLIIISHKSYFDKPITVIQGFLRIVNMAPQLVKAGIFQAVIYMVLVAPFLNFSEKSEFMKSFKIPNFVMMEFEDSRLVTIGLALLGALFSIVVVRWVFLFHCSIIEKLEFKDAMKRSAKLMEGNYIKVLLLVLTIKIVGSLTNLFFVDGYDWLAIKLVETFNLSPIILAIVGILKVAFMFLGYLLMVPIYMIILTGLYIDTTEKTEVQPKKKMVVKNRKVAGFIYYVRKHREKLKYVEIITVILGISASAIYLTYTAWQRLDISITAHRGSSKRSPENTFASTKLSIDEGADYVEIDVQLTKDKVLVLQHDATMKRTAGKDLVVTQSTYDQLKGLDIGSWFDPKFSGERIAKLQEIMDMSRDKIKLNIEVKADKTAEETTKAIVKLIEKNDFYDHCIVTSLNGKVLELVESINPKIKTGFIMYYGFGDFEKLNVDIFSVEEGVVTPQFISKARKLNREVHVWTVNDEESAKKYMYMGVDGILTDYPKEMVALKKEVMEKSTFERIIEVLFYTTKKPNKKEKSEGVKEIEQMKESKEIELEEAPKEETK